MSSINRDMIDYHADTAVEIQRFMWEGKPFQSKKKEHTVKEYEEFLESLRKGSWSYYNEGAKAMGWRD
ncbi:hypothetical protein [Bacillus sp. NPDC094106]|uniref:hypothetical protein n=1 Tax=Bacillus sp. NPDC094106 TaxID=3363949 RepID=UPI003823A04E